MTLKICTFSAWFLGAIGWILYAQCAFGQPPSTLIAPDGSITYVYPGAKGAPTVVIPPSGLPTYVYPGQTPGAPTVYIDPKGGTTYQYSQPMAPITPPAFLSPALPYGAPSGGYYSGYDR